MCALARVAQKAVRSRIFVQRAQKFRHEQSCSLTRILDKTTLGASMISETEIKVDKRCQYTNLEADRWGSSLGRHVHHDHSLFQL